MNRIIALFLFLMLQGGCVKIVIDPSINAALANDRTLVITGCGIPHSPGGQDCRVVEGEEIASGLQLLVPNGDKLKAAEAMVLFKDIQKTFTINSPVTELPFSEIFGEGRWSVSDHDGKAVVLAKLTYEDDAGVEKQINMLGNVNIFVIKKNYLGPLPWDSGYVSFKGRYICDVQCTTAGRCATRCFQ